MKIQVGDYIYSIAQDGREIWKYPTGFMHDFEDMKRWYAPPFQDGKMSCIRETDGGIMVGFTTGAIYYVNPSGEFYHLRTVNPPEPGAYMVGIDPPITDWICGEESQFVRINTDNISDNHPK